MAKRRYKLTWQKGANGRPGRWKKIINGTAYYFDGGNGKTDQAAYKAALKECEALKGELNASQNPHRDEYLKTIQEWEAVAIWSKENGDEERLVESEDRIKELNQQLCKGKRCKPLSLEDRFVTEVGFPIVKLSELGVRPIEPHEFVVDDDVATITTWEHSKEVWRDRLDSIKHREGMTDDTDGTVSVIVDKFIAAMTRKHRDQKLSPGRLANLQASTGLFRDFVGSTKDIASVNARAMASFFEHLRNKVDRKEFRSAATGRDHATNVAQFLRWAWKQEYVESLPRNLGDHEIAVPIKEVKVFTIPEIGTLLKAATPRTRLYILMALNLGMTQQDISDLHPGEVDWRKRTVKRKRSKTKQHESTPMVTYAMWPETLFQLKDFKTNDKNRVLLNKYGLPLKDQEFVDGKYRKTDTVGREFRRLKKKCGINDRTFIDLKKTCRSLLEDHKDHCSIAELFVGRSPKSVSDKHYTKPPETRLAEATDWLRVKLKVEKALGG